MEEITTQDDGKGTPTMEWKRFSFIGLWVCFSIVAVWASAQEENAGNSAFSGPKIATAKRGLSSLPSDAGQFWMDYDLTPYTNLYPSLEAPQQTILDWILFDTQESFWHGEPFGVLSATRGHLYVYHCEKVQRYVANVLDRFLDETKRNELVSVRIILVETPDWRTKAEEYLRPYPVKQKGISGWTIDPANYQSVAAALAKRSDFLELNSSRNLIPNAETFGWVLPSPARNYVRDIQLSAGSPQGYVTDTTAVDEGYRIEITPLLSTNGDLVEFLFTCRAAAVEKMLTVPLKVPTSSSPRQQLDAAVPQIAARELKDKISFPKSQVFLLDLGMIPIQPGENVSSGGLTASLSKTFGGKSVYRNVLLFLRSAGSSDTAGATQNETAPTAGTLTPVGTGNP